MPDKEAGISSNKVLLFFAVHELSIKRIEERQLQIIQTVTLIEKNYTSDN